MSILPPAGALLVAGLAAATAGTHTSFEPPEQTEPAARGAICEAQRAFEQFRITAYPPEDKHNLATLNTLARTVNSAEFNQLPAEEALRQLARDYELNLYVDWASLEDRRLSRTHPITLRLRNVPLGAVVKAMLLEINDGDSYGITCGVDQGVLCITSSSSGAIMAYTRSYDCQDLIDLPLEPTERHILARVVSEIASEERGASSGPTRTELRSIDEYEHMLSLALNHTEREDRVEDLKDVIRESIEPDTWRDNGGDWASLTEYRGVLIVTHTSSVHHRIEAFLNELRATLAVRRLR